MSTKNTSYDTKDYSLIVDVLSKTITSDFSATLAKEQDIINIVKALILYESKFNVNAIGKSVSTSPGTGGYDYINSSAVVSVYQTGDSVKQLNIRNGLRAYGPMQVMGWNFIRGGSRTGVCEIDRLRSDLSATLVINPGDAIETHILGMSNIEKAIKIGLVILEGKYKSVYQDVGVYKVRGDRYNRQFSSKIAAAIAAYLGLGKADLNGTTPEAYTSEILGGFAYNKVLGIKGTAPISNSKVSIKSANGPTTNGSNQSKISNAGCN